MAKITRNITTVGGVQSVIDKIDGAIVPSGYRATQSPQKKAQLVAQALRSGPTIVTSQAITDEFITRAEFEDHIGDHDNPHQVTAEQVGLNRLSDSFINADLSSGILTIAHNFSTKYVMVQIYNNNDAMVIPDEITLVSSNYCEIDLTSYGTISGTWHFIVV